MGAVLVVFHLPEGSSVTQHRRMRRRVYGEDTTAHRGRYHYRTRGVLDEVPFVKLYWGVVMVRQEDWPRLRAVLQELGAIVEHRLVEATAADKRVLAGAAG